MDEEIPDVPLNDRAVSVSAWYGRWGRLMEALFRAALAGLLRVAQAHNRRLLLVGAFARTLCLPESVRGPARKTRDADVAVQMEGWPAFDDFLSACQPAFTVDRTELRLHHAQTGVKIVGGMSLLVPRPAAFVLLKLLSFLDRRAPPRSPGRRLRPAPLPSQ